MQSCHDTGQVVLLHDEGTNHLRIVATLVPCCQLSARTPLMMSSRLPQQISGVQSVVGFDVDAHLSAAAFLALCRKPSRAVLISWALRAAAAASAASLVAFTFSFSAKT